MFSGIVQSVAKVSSRQFKNNGLILTVEKPKNWRVKPGDSICVSGACLTVKVAKRTVLVFELMPETLDKTYLGQVQCRCVNLEPGLKFSDALSGHLVTGHVDALGKILKIESHGATRVFKISVPKKFAKYLVAKGSVAVDGISLTVVEAGSDWFTVSVVDYTLKNTILGSKKNTDPVHLEFDILAKYLEKLTNTKFYAKK